MAGWNGRGRCDPGVQRRPVSVLMRPRSQDRSSVSQVGGDQRGEHVLLLSVVQFSTDLGQLDVQPAWWSVWPHGYAGGGTISNHRQEAELRVRSPHRNPTSPGLGGVPHRFPTAKTAFPGTRRHTC